MDLAVAAAASPETMIDRWSSYITRPAEDCQLVIYMIGATNLAANTKSTPFAVVKVTDGDEHERKTEHNLKTQEPVWNETFTFGNIQSADTIVSVSIREPEWSVFHSGGSRSLGCVRLFKLSELSLPEDGSPKMQARVAWACTCACASLRLHTYACAHIHACARA